MNLQLALRAVKRLREILDNPATIRDPDFGICMNLELGDAGYKLVRELSIAWPKYTGDPSFPVPGDYSYTARYKWVGAYGDLRRELVAYLIAELERRIRKTKKTEYYQQRKDICKALRKNNRKPYDHSEGLCATCAPLNFAPWALFHDSKEALFADWPLFSGSLAYPVNGAAQFDLDQRRGTMYEGASGRLRRSLARFIVAHFKAEQMAMELLS